MLSTIDLTYERKYVLEFWPLCLPDRSIEVSENFFFKIWKKVNALEKQFAIKVSLIEETNQEPNEITYLVSHNFCHTHHHIGSVCFGRGNPCHLYTSWNIFAALSFQVFVGSFCHPKMVWKCLLLQHWLEKKKQMLIKYFIKHHRKYQL